jgi:Ni,Fe-hydrogenase maturation factor
MDLDDLQTISPTQHSSSPHDASLVTAIQAGKRMGLSLPQEITIYAVEVENVTDFSDQPTLPVIAAIPKVTAAVLSELGYSSPIPITH